MRSINLLALTLLGTAVVPATHAADEPAPAKTPVAQATPEVVVVTAQRRKQRQEEVPMSLSVVSGDDLGTERALDVESLERFVPNFQAAGLTAQQPQLTIRGIGTIDRQAGSDQSVVVFVDEQYIGRSSATTFSLLDVDRVEVLRGPQGTLFGRNASGGAISIVNNRPTNAFGGTASASLGNLGLKEGRGVLNVPINADTAARFAVLGVNRDGAYRNVFVDQRAGDRESWMGRGSLQTRFGSVTALVSVEAYHDKVDGLPIKLLRGEGVSDADYAAAVGTFNLASNPYTFPTSRPLDVANNVLGNSKAEGAAVRGRLEWNGDTVSSTVLVGARCNRLNESYDAVGIPIVGSGAASRGFNSTQITRETYDNWSLEARLQSTRPNSALNWIVGANYLRDDVERDVVLERQSNNAYSRPRFAQTVVTDSYAAFGELSWRLARSVEATLGGRYTHDRKDFDVAASNTLTPTEAASIAATLGRPTTLAPAVAALNTTSSKDWTRFTPRAVLRFEPFAGASLYALWSRGYKGGGFFGTPANAAAAQRGFDPETVDNREIGFRSRLAGGKVLFNISAFDMIFSDLQIQDRFFLVPGDATTLVNQVTNAAAAKSRGVEADITVRLLPGLTLSGSVGWLDAKITEVNAGSNLIVGSPLPKSPKNSMNLAAEYSVPLSVDKTLTTRIAWHRLGDNYLDINRRPAGLQPAYSLIDASVGLDVDRWSLSIWGKNLADKRYLTVANLFPNGAAGPVLYGTPRTFGMTATMRF